MIRRGHEGRRSRPWARCTARTFAPLADRYIPTGTPQQVTDRLLEYVDAGAESVVFSPACAEEDLDRVVATVAAEVLPALRCAVQVNC